MKFLLLLSHYLIKKPNTFKRYYRPYGSGVEHFLGKEEVVSSSLTMGSTIGKCMDKSVVKYLYYNSFVHIINDLKQHR